MPKQSKIIQVPSGFKKYADINDSSRINAYKIGPTYIKVQFVSGNIYMYTFKSAGEDHVKNMWEIAEAGNGLNGYINQFCKETYDSKIEV